MRAVVFEEVGRVRVADAPEPRVEEPGDAVVRLTLSAICGSDLHSYHGAFPLERGESMGHEGVGVVEEVGPDVRTVRPGDRVVISFSNVCGECFYCRRGQTALCDRFSSMGFGTYGGGMNGLQAEAARVPGADVNLLPVPDGVDDERALFVGDILTTAMYGAALARFEPGDTVAVVGAGPVGCLVAAAARRRGAGTVLVLDRVAGRVAMAERVGATGVDVSERDAREAVRERTAGRGADAAVEVVGTLAAFDTAAAVIRRGGSLVVLGVFGDERADLPFGRFWNRGLSVAFSGICPVQARWREAMDAVETGDIDPTVVVSHRLPLADAPRGYQLFDAREATKVLLRP